MNHLFFGLVLNHIEYSLLILKRHAEGNKGSFWYGGESTAKNKPRFGPLSSRVMEGAKSQGIPANVCDL